MKKVYLLSLILISFLASLPAEAYNCYHRTFYSPHVTCRGTYVRPYMRTGQVRGTYYNYRHRRRFHFW